MFSSIASLFASKTVLSLIDNNNFKPLYEKINQEVLTGDKIVIVSHSQGNLYANDICRELKSNDKLMKALNNENPFINIQVATPASEIACGSQYVSLKWDKVVNLTEIGSLIPGANVKSPLPGNVIHSSGFINKAGSGSSFLDHGFLDAYLDDPSVAYAVYSKVSSEANKFPFHGFDEPIASYRVTGCPLTQHVKEDKFINKILCKDANEMDSQIKLQANCAYNFTGTTKDSDAEVKFEADAPNYANMKVTYSPELGFKAEISPPEKTAPPFRSFFRIAGWVLGVTITLGGISHYKPLGRSHTDDES